MNEQRMVSRTRKRSEGIKILRRSAMLRADVGVTEGMDKRLYL